MSVEQESGWGDTLVYTPTPADKSLVLEYYQRRLTEARNHSDNPFLPISYRENRRKLERIVRDITKRDGYELAKINLTGKLDWIVEGLSVLSECPLPVNSILIKAKEADYIQQAWQAIKVLHAIDPQAAESYQGKMGITFVPKKPSQRFSFLRRG